MIVDDHEVVREGLRALLEDEEPAIRAHVAPRLAELGEARVARESLQS